jgi:hypothetical protein
MFEVNAANEFTAVIGKEIYAEILATGHPSPAKIRNAMSNPVTWNALKGLGLIPKDSFLLKSSNDPLKVELTQVQPLKIQNTNTTTENNNILATPLSE